jgi:hypothetical protein
MESNNLTAHSSPSQWIEIKKMHEKLIKCKLVDLLLKKYPNSLLGVEIPFLAGKRWVDVLLINKKEEIVAFEVKSKFDSLRRLQAQLGDYLRTFDRVYIVISTKFKDHKLITELPENVGYAYIDNNNQISFIRKAAPNKQLLKLNLSYFLWKKDLLSFSQKQQESVELLRSRLLKNCTVREIHQMAIEALLSRYQDRFNIFKREKSKYTHQEDLEYLTKIYKTDL